VGQAERKPALPILYQIVAREAATGANFDVSPHLDQWFASGMPFGQSLNVLGKFSAGRPLADRPLKGHRWGDAEPILTFGSPHGCR
jgi:hypothetical protein